MAGLKLLIITSAQDNYFFYQHFPTNFNDRYILSELVLISKHFKKCGKGVLINENKYFYYKTYFPEDEHDPLKKKLFLLYYCDSTYKQKHIDDFSTEIFSLLDDVSNFERDNLTRQIKSPISKLFDKYQNLNRFIYVSNMNDLSLSEDNYIRSVTYEKIKKVDDSRGSELSERGDDSLYGRERKMSQRKRIDSRFYFSYQGSKKKMYRKSLDSHNNGLDMIKSVGADTELTLLFKQDDAINYWTKIKPWRTIKKIDISLCFFLFLAVFWGFPVLLYYLNKEL